MRLLLYFWFYSTSNYPHPLHEAVATGKRPGVVRELVMMFGVNKLDDSQRTPLMFAALGNNKRSSCSTLIEFGANVNQQDTSGLTALHVACYYGNKNAAGVLLNKGAVLNILDKKVCSLEGLYILKWFYFCSIIVLCIGAQCRRISVVYSC